MTTDPYFAFDSQTSAQWELYDLTAYPFDERDLAPMRTEIVQLVSGDFAKWAESVQQKVTAQSHDSRGEITKHVSQNSVFSVCESFGHDVCQTMQVVVSLAAAVFS